MDLPIKKGLSSSAAICVLTARAFNRVYDLMMTVRGEMELAYQGEITTPSRCGRMDQGCAFGNRPVLMTFDGDRLDTEELQVSSELHYVVVDLHSKKDTVEILAKLNRSYPFAEDDQERGVQELLGPIGSLPGYSEDLSGRLVSILLIQYSRTMHAPPEIVRHFCSTLISLSLCEICRLGIRIFSRWRIRVPVNQFMGFSLI